jgi:hypothetical protein
MVVLPNYRIKNEPLYYFSPNGTYYYIGEKYTEYLADHNGLIISGFAYDRTVWVEFPTVEEAVSFVLSDSIYE